MIDIHVYIYSELTNVSPPKTSHSCWYKGLEELITHIDNLSMNVCQ